MTNPRFSHFQSGVRDITLLLFALFFCCLGPPMGLLWGSYEVPMGVISDIFLSGVRLVWGGRGCGCVVCVGMAVWALGPRGLPGAGGTWRTPWGPGKNRNKMDQ